MEYQLELSGDFFSSRCNWPTLNELGNFFKFEILQRKGWRAQRNNLDTFFIVTMEKPNWG
jgi:hypothetical protein